MSGWILSFSSSLFWNKRSPPLFFSTLSLSFMTCVLLLCPLLACSFSLHSPSSSPSPSASSVPHHNPSSSQSSVLPPSRGTIRSPSNVPPLGFVVRNPSSSLSSSSATSTHRSSSSSPVFVSSSSSNVCSSSSSSSCGVSAKQSHEAISPLSASPGPRGGESKTSSEVSLTQKNPSSFALTLRSYLRCHMSLLSDSSPTFNNGNLVFLFRAADAHDRLISPLELQTNKHHLPGHQAARTMAILEQQALQYAVEEEEADEHHGRDKAKPSAAKIPENQTELFRSELLKFEVRRLHRILQFTCAAKLRGEVLDRQSAKVMYDLLNEASLSLETVLKAFDRVSLFYQKEMKEEDFNEHFKPALEELKAQLLDLYKESLEDQKDSEKKKSFVVASETLKYEPNPDPRTLAPLLVDVTQMGNVLPGVEAWNKGHNA
ncbi:hypothetical protein CSUI_010590 [Cystoisospora suis]|uniref:Transmembrane protein n=1 Tax=Cystoisospora suis TaxID=483139 RepID=A0A2C6KFZ3_9APIC|nr:hypothetical protein CSUI_010590 [Cystoisospora suis]